MVLERTQAAPVVEDAPVCRHHWIIESAKGRYSRGECRNCREVRTFENSIYTGADDDED